MAHIYISDIIHFTE